MGLLRLLYDGEIPWVEELFSPHCELRRFAAPQPHPTDLTWAEAVLLRSVTQLAAAQVAHLRFVGSATIGIDHLPLEFLNQQGIPWGHAPGCNAEAVADWVVLALTLWASQQMQTLQGKVLGLVGFGHTGQAVARRAPALGLQVATCDPLRTAAGEAGHLPLDELLANSDLVSLHVPLTRQGAQATWGLLGQNTLPMLKQGACLLNCSRGEVVVEADLLAQRARLGGLLLDVFPHEPQPNLDLLRACNLATPHVAGYSQAGKTQATWMLFQAMAQRFGWSRVGKPLVPSTRFNWGNQSLAEGLEQLFGFLSLTQALQAATPFAQLRRDYPFRPEIAEIALAEVPPRLQPHLQRLGFRLEVV